MLDQAFDKVLARRHEAQPGRRKGQRTRDALKRGCAKSLNKLGYREMKVTDITREAGVSDATFWVYFTDKLQITREVLGEFLDELLASAHPHGLQQSAYQVIYGSNLLWIANARRNGGLMRCLLQLSDEVPDFAQILHRADETLNARIVRSFLAKAELATPSPSMLDLAVHLLSALMDRFTQSLLLDIDAGLPGIARDLDLGDPQLAEILSITWYRVLFARDPDTDELQYPELLQAMPRAAISE